MKLEEVKSSGHFLFLPASWSSNSVGEVTEWSHFPPENLQLHPCTDYRKPRGLWSQQEQLQQQWDLLREGEDVKTGYDDPVTRQTQSISNG
jgi:hypothetical protein